MRKRIDDLADLVIAATKEITSALIDGDEKHEAGSWQFESTGEQFNHINDHFRRIQAGEFVDAKGHSHLAHIICRAAMVSILLEKK